MPEEEKPPMLELVKDEEVVRPTIVITFLEEVGDVSVHTQGEVGLVLAIGMLGTALGWFQTAPVRNSVHLLTQSIAYASMAPDGVNEEVH